MAEPANMEIQRPRNTHQHYHAHVYFDEPSADQANKLCQDAGKRFAILVGRFHKRPVGPHPMWSCQLSFDTAQFQQLIDWLEQNRDGLTVFVHGLSGNGLEDHTTHATWLGTPATLDLSGFQH